MLSGNIRRIVGVGFLLFIASISSIYAYSSISERTQQAKPPPVVITLEKDGFHPSEITIRKGQSVTFTSSVAKPFWPASDFHPTHGIYPEFDPAHPIAGTSTWTFVFDTAGTWGFHDHLFPKHSGTISVKNKFAIFNFDTSPNKDCSSKDRTPVKKRCYVEKLLASVSEDGIGDALDIFESFYANDTDFRKYCHDFTHYLGNVAYEQYKNGTLITPDARFEYCGFGFYHGFMKSLIFSTGDSAMAREFCDGLESQLTPPMRILSSCLHGIGHGATDDVDSSTWGNPYAITKQGLDLCRKIASGDMELERCSGGVFHALETMYSRPEYKLHVNQIDPFAPCRRQAVYVFRHACYKNFKALIFEIRDRDLIKAAGDVSTIANAEFAISAMDSLTTYAAKYVKNIQEDAKNISTCLNLDDLRLRTPCITGFGAGFMSFSDPGEEYARALDFCGNALLPEEGKRACYSRILWISSTQYTSEKHSKVCSMVDKNLREFCPEES